MAENTQTPKSKRDTFRESHTKRHPELNWDDEEAVYGSINDDYGNFDNQINELTESNNRYKKDQDDFIAAISSGENNGEYIDGMMNGREPLDTAIGIHGYDGLIEYLSDPETREAYIEADKRHQEKLDKQKKFEEEKAKNAEETDAAIGAAIEAGEFTMEEYNEAVNGLFDIADGITLNVCKPEWIKMWLAAKNHDADVDAARAKGELDGRNAGIEENIRKTKNTNNDGKKAMPIGVGGKPVSQKPNANDGKLAGMLFSK